MDEAMHCTDRLSVCRGARSRSSIFLLSCMSRRKSWKYWCYTYIARKQAGRNPRTRTPTYMNADAYTHIHTLMHTCIPKYIYPLTHKCRLHVHSHRFPAKSETEATNMQD